MKNLLLICLVFLFGKLSTFAQTITFDDQGYTNNQALGNPYSIINNGETFLFTVSNGGAPNATDNIYRTDENSCGASGLGHLYAGNFSATTWTIETSSGNEINLGRVRFDNIFPCFSFSYSLTIEGFKNSVSTGTQTLTVSGLNSVFTSNSSFDDVDRIVITAMDLANLGIDDIEFEVVLPVELLDFKGAVNDDAIELRWQTMSEWNNDRFEIEESKDGIRFEKIGEVKGNGTTSEQQAYSFVIEKPETGLKYYRLKQVDYDNQFEYSKIINVDFVKLDESFGSFYPNPSNGLVSLDYEARAYGEIIISIFDVTGKIKFEQFHQVSKGNNHLNFDFSNISPGIYLVEIRAKRKSTYQKIIIER